MNRKSDNFQETFTLNTGLL